MGWQSIYKSKTVTAEQAIALLRDNDRIVLGFGCAEPYYIESVIAENYEKFNNVEIVTMLSLKPSYWCEPKMAGHIKLNCLFAGPSTRDAISIGLIDFTTCYFHEIPEFIKTYVNPRVAIAMVSPPDEHGYVSFGTNVDYIYGACDIADVVIAQVNKNMPRTFGAGIKHVSEFDCFVEHNDELPEIIPGKITDTEVKIGKYCAELIQDGDCLQLGIGGIPNAVCAQLFDKKNLGLHSELIGDGVVPLLENGIINNKYKKKKKGRSVIGFAFGSKELNKYINNNPSIELMPIDYVNNPSIIAKNDNVVSVNSALQVDLLGQVVADTIGLSQFSAVGGQVDFIRGAAMSKGGRSIIAMPSTARGGTLSRIVPFLTPGSAVTTPRNDINYIVTEFGIAQLKGKSSRERARALIKIAHPDFREQLENEFGSRFKESVF